MSGGDDLRKRLADLTSEAGLLAEADKHFNQWLSEPLVRMTVSMVPPGEHQDTLKTLLRSAYDRGFAIGGAVGAVGLLANVLKDKT